MVKQRVAITCVFEISFFKEHTAGEISRMLEDEVHARMQLPATDTFQIVEIEEIE